MRRAVRQGYLGGVIAALLLVPCVAVAQNLVSPLSSSPAGPATTTPSVTMVPSPPLPTPVIKPAIRAPKTATLPAKPPVKKVAAAPRKPAAKVAAAPKKPEPTKVAAVPPAPVVTVAAPAPVRPAPTLAAISAASYGPSSAPATPRAAPAMPATQYVSTFLGQAFRIARDASLNSLQRRAALADLFGAKLDVGRIAGITTADELTGEPSDFQRRFRTVLISYLVETYYPRIELASDASVKVQTVAGAPQPDGTLVVWTTFNKSDWVTQSVKWILVPEGDGYKIVDIFSSGASLVQMERDTFLSVMRDGGLPELLAKLDARTRALATAATE